MTLDVFVLTWELYEAVLYRSSRHTYGRWLAFAVT